MSYPDSGSEDGQLHSPNGDFGDDDQIEVADSLDIKPPQHQIRVLSERKKFGREKKPSKANKNEDCGKEREHMLHDRQNDRSEEVNELDEKRYRHFIRENRDRRNHRHDYYDRAEQQQKGYHNRHNRSRDMRVEHDIREMNKKKIIEYENKADAEKALEDLRTRLLNKRHKYQKGIDRFEEHGSGCYKNTTGHILIRSDIGRQRKKDCRHRERKEHVIEVIDSPEQLSDYSLNTKRKEKEREKEKGISNDSEQIARRARLLEAEREMSRRKELAREELEARREKRRDKTTVSSLVSQHKTTLKRHSEHNRKDQISRKCFKKSLRNEKELVDLLDSLEESSEYEEEDIEKLENESGLDNRSTVSEKFVASKYPRKSPKDNQCEGELLLSGLPSVGKLSKSERRPRSKLRSRSPSTASQRCSRSPHSTHSKTTQSHHFLRKSSRSQGRSLTKSRSRSISRFESKSHSKSRSNSRSTSHSRSVSRNQNDGDDPEDTEIKSVDNFINTIGSNDNYGKTSLLKDDNTVINENDGKLPNYYPAIQGCRSVEEFQCLNRIEEGTYGVVYRAKDKKTSEIVALKRLKMEKEKEGFPITSLREINTLLKSQHPNIVTVREIVVGSNMDKIFIVMDYVEHDLKSLMETMKHKEQSFFAGEVKCLTQQLLKAVAHLHDNWILHRDLKTSNLLLSHRGILKVGDFGLAREYGSPLKQYTSLVVTLWYRAPELLLCSKEYSTPIDMWSVGCIFAEFLQMGPLFPGKSEIDQLNRIFKELGTPNEKIWPGHKELPTLQNLHFTEYPVSNLRKHFINKTTELGLSLLQGLLTYDPKQRYTAEQALRSPYFKELPLPIDPSMFPTWPAKSELGARKALASSPKPPSGGSQFKQLGCDDSHITSSLSKNNSSKTGFVLNANVEQRQVAMAPGFNLKF